MTKAITSKALAEKLRRYRADPVLFCNEILGFEPWEKQAELARAIAANKLVACRSGHKCGKTTILAAVGLWFLTCFPRSRVVMTAPAAPQIERGLWAEVKRLWRQAAKRGTPLGGTLNETPWSGLVYPDGRDLYGRSTNKKESFAGISAPNLLFLVDEASGIDEEIWEAIFGNSGGGAWIAAISNPTQLSGRFYNAFHGARDHWHLVHISSEDSPNFHGKFVEGLATPGWAKQMAAEYGKPSVHYDVRVLGNFPSQAENSVIGFGLVEASLARAKLLAGLEKGTLTAYQRSELGSELDKLEALAFPTDPLIVGVDVARFGDDSTCFVPVRGLRMYEPKILNGFDVTDVAGHAHQFARDRARRGELPMLRIDANGVGAGVYDQVRRMEHARATEVNVSEKALEHSKYVRRRDELWFGMRDWLQSGGILPIGCPRLEAELIAPTYSFDVLGRRQVESKKDIKKRLGRSPDVADAACLAVSNAIVKSRAGELKELRKGLRSRAWR